MRQTCSAFADCLARLAGQAGDFVPASRREQTLRRWIGANPADKPRYAAFARRAGVLVDDYLLSVPSASGGTAFDRLARGFAGTAQDMEALTALRASRFRVLRVTRGMAGGILACTDLAGQVCVRVDGGGMPTFAAGAVCFGRMAQAPDGTLHAAGPVTQLDEAAQAVATGAACPPSWNREKQARWVEAVYIHVLRHAPDSKAPDDMTPLSDIPGELASIVTAFENLQGAPPDQALIDETRRQMSLAAILTATIRVAQCRARGERTLALAFERVALLLLETLHNRETLIGGRDQGYLSIGQIGEIIEDLVTRHGALPAWRDVFRELSRRAASAAAKPDDVEMQRLIGRIQALRAKTVDQGCTEQEALAAAEKAAALLDRHGLTLSELAIAQQPCGGVVIATDRKRQAAADQCAPPIAAFFDCRHWTEQLPGDTLRHVFFGMRADVAAAEFLFAMVEQVFADELTAFQTSELYLRLRGDRHAATKSFQEGLAHGICTKLTALRESRAARMVGSSGRDLVPAKTALVNAAVDTLGLNFSSRSRNPSSRTLLEPFVAGQAAAERFAYLPGLAAVG